MRREHGDVFLLEVFWVKFFFVFSQGGLEEFYKVPETEASFTEATKGFLGVKVPEEIMRGSMATIQRVLRRDFQMLWKNIFSVTMHEALDEMGDSGELSVFEWSKKVAHKAGFRSWIGDEAVDDPVLFRRLVHLFDQIDPEVAFTQMSSLLSTILTRRSKERKALYEIVDILAKIRSSRAEPKGDFLEALHEEFSHLDEAQRNLDVTCQILAIHMASQSNLFAAIAWTIVNIAARPNVKSHFLKEISEAKEEFGGDFFTNSKCKLEYLEKCYYESIRISQQSLTLRLVLQPIKISDYDIVPGYYIATLLSCLNTDSNSGILVDADKFLPEQHYEKGGKLKGVSAGAEYSISTFGYGPHSCPGRAFANSAAKAVCGALFDRFELDVPSKCEIIPSQMGAVGRPVVPPTIPYKMKI